MSDGYSVKHYNMIHDPVEQGVVEDDRAARDREYLEEAEIIDDDDLVVRATAENDPNEQLDARQVRRAERAVWWAHIN